MQFITFSGVDGSGKSTQLNLLKEHLLLKGYTVSYFHAVEFSLANKISRFFRGGGSFEPGKEKAVTRASWFSLLIRQKFLFFDILRFRFLLRRLEKEHCDFLLSDRYFYDSLINLSYLGEHTPRIVFWNLRMRVLEKMIHHPDAAFYFDIDPEIIMTRDRAPEQGIDYLRAKQILFKEKCTDWQLIPLDASWDTSILFQDILSRIEK